MEHGWCPTNYPGRTPIRIAGRFAVLLDFPGFLMLDQPPKRYGTWFESDQLPWSDTLEQLPKCYGTWVSDQPTSSDTELASVSAETTFYWACDPRFSLARKFPFLEIENPIAETQGAEDEMLPSPLAEFLRHDAKWRFPARALRGG